MNLGKAYPCKRKSLGNYFTNVFLVAYNITKKGSLQFMDFITFLDLVKNSIGNLLSTEGKNFKPNFQENGCLSFTLPKDKKLQST